jgi:ribosomal protein L16 Arg81 hydroxylase
MFEGAIHMTVIPAQADVSRPVRRFPELTRLIHPFSVADFFASHWEREPLLVQRDDAGYYADLLTLDGIDEVLSQSGPGLDNLRVVVDGKETPVAELGRGRGRNGTANALETLYERYRSGSTVVVDSLQDRWPPLQRLAAALGAELDARVQMNIYLTPAGNQGFAPHYDTHDVFVAQVYGSKVWRLAGAPYPLPLRSRPYDRSQVAPQPAREFELRAGDVLYLPRGTIHSATANDTASLHVTIGVHPMLWTQAIEDAISRAFAEDARFRAALPIGFATDHTVGEQARQRLAELLDLLRDRLSPSAITADAAERLVSVSAPPLRGHLLDLEDLPKLDTSTPLRRRPGLRWTVTVDDTVASLLFHNKAVRFPAEVADEVRFAAGQDGWFTAAAIPGDLDEPGRKTLVHTLLREGFLTTR